jgi:hypothetical protein
MKNKPESREIKPESGEIDVGGEATFAGPRGCLMAAQSAKREKMAPKQTAEAKTCAAEKKERDDGQLVKIRARYAKIQP